MILSLITQISKMNFQNSEILQHSKVTSCASKHLPTKRLWKKELDLQIFTNEMPRLRYDNTLQVTRSTWCSKKIKKGLNIYSHLRILNKLVQKKKLETSGT